jgi:hypothetical protein
LIPKKFFRDLAPKGIGILKALLVNVC